MSRVVTALRRFWTRPSPTIRAGLSGHDNSLGLLRLLLASAVILSHAFPLGGWGDDPTLRFTQGQDNLGGLAVVGFFAISGYLIAKSGARTDVVAFLWHRFLRIYPAFILVLLVGAFVVGPFAWLAMGRGLDSYFVLGPGGPFAYIYRNILLDINQYGVLDVFRETTPYGAIGGSVLNGSLWTLAHEFFCYLVIGALVLTTVMARPRLARFAVTTGAVGVFFIQLVKVYLHIGLDSIIPFLNMPNRTQLLFVFLIGSLLAVWSDKIVLDDRVAILCVIVVLVTMRTGGLWVWGYPAIAYFLLWLAARLPARFRRIGAENDYSYGIYLYGFLVQQTLAALGVYHWGYIPYVLLALAITVGCAWLSWHGLEKRALEIKGIGPGRGIRYWCDRTRSRRGGLPPAHKEAA